MKQGGSRIWAARPPAVLGRFYRSEEGHYRVAFNGDEGWYQALVLPDFWLHVEWLWQDPLPTVEEMLLEMGGTRYARRWIERLQQHGFLPPEG